MAGPSFDILGELTQMEKFKARQAITATTAVKQDSGYTEFS